MERNSVFLDFLVKECGIEKSKWFVVTVPEINVAGFKKHFIWSGGVAFFREIPLQVRSGEVWTAKVQQFTHLERYLSGSMRSRNRSFKLPIVSIVCGEGGKLRSPRVHVMVR